MPSSGKIWLPLGYAGVARRGECPIPTGVARRGECPINHMTTLCKAVINSGVSVTHPGPRAMSVFGKRRRLRPGRIDISMGLEGRGEAARWHRGKDL